MRDRLPDFQPVPGMPEGWARRGGIPWSDAPLPARWHRCRPWQAAGFLGRWIERCACGATRTQTYPRWHDRNTRRHP